MKKMFLMNTLLLLFYIANSQEINDTAKNEIISNTGKYITKLIPKKIFLKYWKVDEIIKKEDIRNPDIVYYITYKFSSDSHPDSYEIGLNDRFEVVEKTYGDKNYTILFIKSKGEFLELIERGLIVSPEKVHEFISSLYPAVKWGMPEIRRNSFSPYNHYYEIMEDHCSQCMTRKVYLDKIEECNNSGNKVQLIKMN